MQYKATECFKHITESEGGFHLLQTTHYNYLLKIIAFWKWSPHVPAFSFCASNAMAMAMIFVSPKTLFPTVWQQNQKIVTIVLIVQIKVCYWTLPSYIFIHLPPLENLSDAHLSVLLPFPSRSWNYIFQTENSLQGSPYVPLCPPHCYVPSTFKEHKIAN
jgi:hypothetical protein